MFKLEDTELYTNEHTSSQAERVEPSERASERSMSSAGGGAERVGARQRQRVEQI